MKIFDVWLTFIELVKTYQTVALKGSYDTGEKGYAYHYIYKLSYGVKHKRKMPPLNPCW